MAFRQLVSSDNCGTANPLAGLAGPGNNALLAGEAASFGPGKQIGVQGGPIPREMLQAHHPRDPELVARYNAEQTAMQRQRNMHQNLQAAEHSRMVAEFEAMRVSDQQRIHAQAAEWEKSFQLQQQQQQHRPVPGMVMQHPSNPAVAHSHLHHAHHHPGHLSHPPLSFMSGPSGMGLPPQYMIPPQPGFQPLPQQQFEQPAAVRQESSAIESQKTETTPTVDSGASQEVGVNGMQQSGAGSGSGGIDMETMRELRESGDEKFRNSKFLRFVDDVNSGRVVFRGNEAVYVGGEEQTGLGAEGKEEGPAETVSAVGGLEEDGGYPLFDDGGMDDFGSRLQAQMLAQARDGEYGDFLQKLLLNPDADPGDLLREHVEQKESHAHYSFLKQNEVLEELRDAAQDPSDAAAEAFERGLAFYEAGDLLAAVRAFEAAVQLEEEHSEAWRYLGQTHSELDLNDNAIGALRRSIAIDPYNLPALMMLGVSYQNDLRENQALQHLRTWLMHNPEYSDIGLEKLDQEIREYQEHYTAADSHQELGWGRLSGTEALDTHLHNQIAKMFQEAARAKPGDADLHVVLGVLYHLSDDYELTVEQFKSALRARPDDASLWGKLGATLANSERYEEALHAYERSLQLRPTSARVLVNRGVSLANMGQHKPAALAYIQALDVSQRTDRGWSYLRIALSHLGDPHLMEMVDRKDLEGLKRALSS